jgi:hypothetical protein
MTDQRESDIWEATKGSWSWKVFDPNTGRIINQGSGCKSHNAARAKADEHL